MNIDIGFAGSEPVILEGIVKPVQVVDLHPEQKAASPPVSASDDTAMGDASKMAASDLDSRLSSFLARFKAKRRKTGKSQAHLASQEGKDVREPLVSRTRKKTKVESSFPQVPVTVSVHGSLGSFGLVSQPPLGPSGRTRSKKKTSRESVERERRARLLSFFSLSFFTCSPCCTYFYFVDEW